MRDNKPLNIPNALGFLEIDGKLVVHGEPKREMPFIYDPYPQNRFRPILTAFKWQTAKEVEVILKIRYDLKVMPGLAVFNGGGEYVISLKWDVQYGKNGITLLDPAVRTLSSKRKGDFEMLVEVNRRQPTLESDVATTLLDLTLTGVYADGGASFERGGFTVPLGGDKGTYVKTYEFAIVQHATGRTAAPVELPEKLLSHNVMFEKEDQSQISHLQFQRLEDTWADPLRDYPELVDALRTGRCSLTLNGYASVTGRDANYNLILSSQRISSVAAAISKILKSEKIGYLRTALGQTTARQPGAADQERRVEIVIDRQGATAALSKIKKAS
jgi:outer membrane protein OmpA-like peptidoglycan-associated protein